MRRIFTTAVAVALMGGAALSAPAVADDRDRSIPPATTGVPIPSEPLQVSADPELELGKLSASDTLATARRMASGDARPTDASATLVLRELWLKRKLLRGAERRQADSLLARPSDGPNDHTRG